MRRLSDRIKNYSTVATAFRGVTVELPKFTGAIEIGDQGAGNAGQILVSGGIGSEPQWVDATSTMSANEMLTSIKTVDGAASGLDADTLDGQQGSYYLDYTNFTNTPTIPSNTTQLTNGSGYITGNQTITLSGDVSGSGTTSIAVTVADDSHNHSSSSGDFAVGGNLNMGSWGFVNNGTKLTIQYGGVTVGSIDNSGNLIVTGNVTAYGTP